MKKRFVGLLVAGSVGVLSVAVGCGKDGGSTDIQETGQQIGDVMASIDESGGGSGSFAMMESAQRVYARHAPSEAQDSWIGNALMPKAYAQSCLLVPSFGFGACTGNVITRTFDGCTLGSLTLSGTVNFTFDDATVDGTCAMASVGHSISRAPDFTATGRRGATLTVSKADDATYGQRITKGSGTSFTFENDGIQRKLTLASGAVLLDYTTETTEAITISGVSRANRTMSGGALKVTNNLTGTSCEYAPTDVKWKATCNCPTSGSWSGNCSDGKTSSLNITGCGTGDLKVGDQSESFTFDRCYGV